MSLRDLRPLCAGVVLIASLAVWPSAGAQTGDFDLHPALAAAHDGDTISVPGGVYYGSWVIDKSVTLEGIDRPVLDGGGVGTVMTISAPDVTVRGFVVRGSGANLEREDTGILATAARAWIEDNRVEDALFGIYLKQAPGSVLERNVVIGKALPVARRGDGLKIWYSPDARLEGNQVEGVRDVVIWYSSGLILRNNVIQGGRYGLHFMFDNQALLEGNTLRENSVGVYLMYSHSLTVRRNMVLSNRGPSGYGLGLKDTDDVTVEDNVFADNRGGLFLDNPALSFGSTAVFRRNLIAFNDIGAILLPNVNRSTFAENTFLENQEQIEIEGGGELHGTRWTLDGQGNYWSDYTGLDTTDDGIGDLPYRSESLYENVMDRYPALRLFQMSPAAQAIDLAAHAFPVFKPRPKITDPAPLMSPVIPAGLVAPSRGLAGPFLGVSLAIIVLALIVVWRTKVRTTKLPFVVGASAPKPRPANRSDPMIQINHLTKRFGKLVAVQDLSLSVGAGEAVAFWGPNGAGKTTVLKCLLGLLPYTGQIIIAGHDARRDGRSARRTIGYVPQEQAFYDMNAAEALAFYARLKKVSAERTADVLNWVGLEAHRDKPVPALSGGMKQRLALAVALLADPPVLVLDEPTSNLDARGREDFLSLLNDLKANGKTILFTSHRLEDVEGLAERVIVLDHGSVTQVCAPVELANRLGLYASLRIAVDEPMVDQALDVLTASGFESSRNGDGVCVRVNPQHKALPIRVLEQAQIPVEDFEVEQKESYNGL